MHNRERGAAYINVYYFLVLLVLFLGTLWFGYMQMSQINLARADRADAIAARKKLEAELAFRDHYIAEITEVVGEPGTWDGKEGFNYQEGFGTDKPEALKNAAQPKEVKAKLEQAARALGLPISQATPISPFLGQVDTLHKDQEAKVAKALQDLQTAQAAQAQLANDFRNTDAKNTADLNKERSDHTQMRNNLDNRIKDLDRRIGEANTTIRQVNDEKAELVEQHSQKVAVMNKRHDQDQGQLEAYKAKFSLINPPDEADGRVISASMKANLGWIDIGKKDMLQRGMKFRITDASGNRFKGHGEVVDVQQDRAEIKLTDVVDRVAYPIGKGDRIFNTLYSPNLKRNVALIGRFSYPYTKPMIEDLLKRHGNVIFDDVRVGVDLVVVGLQDPNEAGDGLKPIEETEGYKKAQELRCEIITIQKIRDLLELGD